MDEDVRKLVEDPNFEAFAAQTKERKFNAFDVLRYSDYEIRHSNVLAWLLTPDETHGVGDAFLVEFLKRLAEKKGAAPRIGDLASFDTCLAGGYVRVERELDYVDLTVFFEKEPRFLLAIENKTGQRLPEHCEQVRRFEKKLRTKYGKKYRIQSVLLSASPEGKSEHADHLHLSWHEVRCLVEGLQPPDGERKDFVSQYVEIVDRNVLGRGPTVDSFDRLVKSHRSVLQRLLKEWKPGKVLPGWGVPCRHAGTVDRLLGEFRQRPAELRDAVRVLLQRKGFETQARGAHRRVYWVSFWDGRWDENATALGIDEQGWWFEFTRRSVTAKLGGGRVAGKELRIVSSIMDLLRRVPVEGTDPGRFPLKFDDGYPYFYQHDLLTEADFADSSPQEIKALTLERVKRFLESPDYKKIENYLRVLAFRPSAK